MWAQREIELGPRPRGFHLVTREVVDALPELGEPFDKIFAVNALMFASDADRVLAALRELVVVLRSRPVAA